MICGTTLPDSRLKLKRPLLGQAATASSHQLHPLSASAAKAAYHLQLPGFGFDLSCPAKVLGLKFNNQNTPEALPLARCMPVICNTASLQSSQLRFWHILAFHFVWEATDESQVPGASDRKAFGALE